MLEQNYRYDLLSPQKLLQKYVGRKVKLYRWDDKRGRDIVYNADLLSVANGQAVVRVNGEVTYGFPGRFAFPSVPDNLIAKPTLVWQLRASSRASASRPPTSQAASTGMPTTCWSSARTTGAATSPAGSRSTTVPAPPTRTPTSSSSPAT